MEVENLKALVKGHKLNAYQKALANSELNRLLKIKDALQGAVNGLEWHKDDDPIKFDKADDEKLFEWKELLNL